MFNIVLLEPEIPPNTGNVIRLCAISGCQLHLVQPLGFELDDRRLRRAGLDYHEYADVRVHPNLDACLDPFQRERVFAFSTRGQQRHDQVVWQAGDVLLFGPETRGLPEPVLTALPAAQRVRLPMRPGLRSLNLSNAVAIATFEAWRQHDFDGA